MNSCEFFIWGIFFRGLSLMVTRIKIILLRGFELYLNCGKRYRSANHFYFSNDCSKDLRIFINCSVNLWFSFFIRWISSSWAIFISRWFLSSSSKVFWICWRLSRCRAAASRFRLRLRFRCCSWKVKLRDKIETGWKWTVFKLKEVWWTVFKLKEVWFQRCFFLSCLTYFSQDHSEGPSD